LKSFDRGSLLILDHDYRIDRNARPFMSTSDAPARFGRSA
jgi:hypothetical protein